LVFLPALLCAAEYAGGVQAKALSKTRQTSNGAPIEYLQTSQPEITVMKVDIAPGAQTGWHKHSVPVYAYVLSGFLTVNIEGHKPLTFKTGDVIIEVVNTRHNGINTGKKPVQLIVFYTGAVNVQNVIKETAP